MLTNRQWLRTHVDQAGDTIIEVMIVLAVLGLAIGISYATANRSLLNARQAQENSQATTAAQSQVEQLVSIGCVSGNSACDITNPANPGHLLISPPAGQPFCVVNNIVTTYTDPNCPLQAPLPGSKVCIVTRNLGNSSDADCQKDVSLAPNVLEVRVSWDDILGQGRDTVTQDYTLPL